MTLDFSLSNCNRKFVAFKAALTSQVEQLVVQPPELIELQSRIIVVVSASVVCASVVCASVVCASCLRKCIQWAEVFLGNTHLVKLAKKPAVALGLSQF